MSQPKMFSIQKAILLKRLLFSTTTQQNLIIGKYLPTFNNISEQNWLDNPVFNSINGLNYSSSMKNTVTNKTKHLPQLFSLRLQILVKQIWHHFYP